MSRSARSIVVLLLAGSVRLAAAGGPDSETAVASCKQHISQLLHGSVETTFAGGGVEALAGGEFQVSGAVVSKAADGGVRRGDFKCRAQRSGASLWTTKTELAIDP